MGKRRIGIGQIFVIFAILISGCNFYANRTQARLISRVHEYHKLWQLQEWDKSYNLLSNKSPHKSGGMDGYRDEKVSLYKDYTELSYELDRVEYKKTGPANVYLELNLANKTKGLHKMDKVEEVWVFERGDWFLKEEKLLEEIEMHR